MRNLRSAGLALALVVTWLVGVYHVAVFPPPPATRTRVRPDVAASSRFLPRATAGLNHLVLFGSPYERGLMTGRLTAPLLLDEETQLVGEMNRFFPNPVVRWGLMMGAMRWFWGIEAFLYPWATDEMYGVSRSAPAAFDYLVDPFTRQVAYHGVHEIGQMFVDFERQDFGCTLVYVPRNGSWLIGRNFDFEAVRILDTEKIAKWVFPDVGHAYLAVTWAGMVGLVTGVNDHGVYISINAAGTRDFARYGSPTTLVVLRALLEADTARAAARIIEEAQTFISDVFVAADGSGDGVYVVEKSPRRFRTRVYREAGAVTNHFTAPEFQDDPVNRFRMREQTTVARFERAQELVHAWAPPKGQSGAAAAAAMAEILRDKRGKGGAPLHLGHRSALDALIATHSVVYNAADQEFWISQGPALTGPYLGYDLARSFRERTPVAIGTLPPDAATPPAVFAALRRGLDSLKRVKSDVKAGRCAAASTGLAELATSAVRDHYEFLMAYGDYEKGCEGNMTRAKTYWQRSLAATPAYLRHELYLKEALR